MLKYFYMHGKNWQVISEEKVIKLHKFILFSFEDIFCEKNYKTSDINIDI